MPPIRQGSIVVFNFTPQRGKPVRRYCVVYTPDAIIDQSETLDLVMISKSIYPNDPDCIPLPYHPDGNVSTKLRLPSAIVLKETDTVRRHLVTPTWGYISMRSATGVEMLAGLKRLGKL